MQEIHRRVENVEVEKADRIWDESEVAEFFGYSNRTISRWRQMGALPFVKLPSGRMAYRAAAIRQVVETWDAQTF